MEMGSQQPACLSQLPASHPILELAVAGLEGRVLVRQLMLLGVRSQHPKHAAEHKAGVIPGAACSCPHAAADAIPAPLLLSIRRSVPSVLLSALAGMPEHFQNDTDSHFIYL